MLSGQQVQRLGSHIARSRPVIEAACRSFAAKLGTRVPAARGCVNVDDRNTRYRVGAAIATVAHHLAELPALSGWLRGAGLNLVRAGVGVGDYPSLAAAMLSSVRSAADRDWTPELEADYRQLIEFVTGEMARGAAGHRPEVRVARAA